MAYPDPMADNGSRLSLGILTEDAVQDEEDGVARGPVCPAQPDVDHLPLYKSPSSRWGPSSVERG